MMLFSSLLVFIPTMVASVVLTRLVERHALRRSILDRPNDRSLHEQPTPRGGGIAIAITFMIGVVLLGIVHVVPANVVMALVGGGTVVALVGWRDDRVGLSARVRFLAHTGAAIWALASLGWINAAELGNYRIELGLAGNIVAVLGVVWWINLYNFMDGIDGIAGGHAFTVACSAAVLMALRSTSSLALLPVVLAGAAAGFLVFNWSPARIFMGDVGSGFLGFAFAIMAIIGEKTSALPIVFWVVLSGVFIFDSTITLVRRAMYGERWYAAHKAHAYQRLIAHGYSHRAVATGVLILNVVIFAVVALPAHRSTHVLWSAGIVLSVIAVLYLFVERLEPMRVHTQRTREKSPL